MFGKQNNNLSTYRENYEKVKTDQNRQEENLNKKKYIYLK